MKSLVLVTVAGLLVGLAAFGVACKNSASGLTLEEYFQKIDSVQEDTDSKFATDEAAMVEPTDDSTDKERADFLKEAVGNSGETLRKAANRADAINPPDEVEQPHNELAAALDSAADEIGGAGDNIPDAMTIEEFQAADQTIFGTQELTAAFDALDAACTALEQIAADNNITVDLACGTG